METPVYLDYNATTPVDPEVWEAMKPYFRNRFGNPSSSGHSFGWMADEACEVAREQVAELVGARTEEIVFTAGATESLNLAAKGAAAVYGENRDEVIVGATEHKAALGACRALGENGFTVRELPVDEHGVYDLAALEELLGDRTLLVALMWANNETGTLQPIVEAAERVHEYGAFLLTDATQGIGKVPVDVEYVDMLACSGHKFYAPKGVGALYVSRKDPRIQLEPLLHGGGHENGLRSGTLNVPGIVGLGRAAERAGSCREEDAERLNALRDELEERLLDAIPGAKVNGHPTERLPQTLNLTLPEINVDDLLGTLREVALSSGSACQSANPKASHVLKAMGLTDEEAFGSVRFSLGRFTTAEQVEFAADRVIQKVERLQQMPAAMQGGLSAAPETA